MLSASPVTVAPADYDLTIEESPATITTIAGESGSGKSTLANLVLGFTDLTSGQIIYRGRNLAEMTAQERIDYRREVQGRLPGSVCRLQPVLPCQTRVPT